MTYHHRDGAQARSSPPRGRGTLGQRYEDDSLSFVAIKKVSSPLARTPTCEGSGAQSAFRMLDIARARMENMHGALDQKHKGVPMLAPTLEPEVLNKEPDLAAIVAAPGGAPNGPISSTRSDQAEDDVRIVTAPGGASQLVPTSTRSDKVAELEVLNKDPAPSSTLPAPGGAANLALALAMAMVLTEAARQAKQQANPSCLALTAATATSSPTADAVPITADALKRDGAARGAATGGDAGTSRLASQGRGDRQGQGDERAGKAAGARDVFAFAGGRRRGPSARARRPAAGNSLRLGGRAGRPGGLHAWWPAPTSSDGEILCTPHLTGSGRLLMARRRLLLLRCGGHVVRRGCLR